MSARRSPRVALGRKSLAEGTVSPPKRVVDETLTLFKSSQNHHKLSTDRFNALPIQHQPPPSPRQRVANEGTATVSGGLLFPPISPRNTRSGANPIYPLSATRHMVQQTLHGAGYADAAEQFGSHTYMEQQQRDRQIALESSAYKARRKANAEEAIVSGRAEADQRQKESEEKRIEGKRAQRELYEQRVYSIAEKERRRARNWM